MFISTSSQILLCNLVTLASALSLPPPTGKYSVGVKLYVLPKVTPSDPVAPNGTGTSILLHFYYPTLHDGNLQPYIDHGLADYYEEYWALPRDTIYNITAKYSVNATSLPKPNASKLPTLLFGPPFAGPSSQCFFSLFSDLASHGYTVVTIDHPYEQPFLEYPDGTGYPGLPVTFEPTYEFLLDVNAYRLTDTSAVLDALPHIAKQWGADAPLNLTHFVTFGHSLGGSAALSSILVERERKTHGRKLRFLGALNIDGTNIGNIGEENATDVDLRIPSLLLASSIHTNDMDPTWPNFEAGQSAWLKQIQVGAKSNHSDFSDTILWKQYIGVAGGGDSIKAGRMISLTRKLVGDFFQFVNGGGEGILSGSKKVKKEWPELMFVVD
ncbi:hypothetical protein P154DRAFT_523820 [Amniculicola lignicola CBS 123094]|uniref:1-alkyl-2-acetylglycerophosphocholine esterase n=1 Tax=Amniculicola lignicola CBS 123094 TaxID=1392246 RepID=A0A6A5WA51_9PLEO|nr:hypothetical protein P154DRAFT_523820 [Amniculicola lignicola CBS 123094]